MTIDSFALLRVVLAVAAEVLVVVGGAGVVDPPEREPGRRAAGQPAQGDGTSIAPPPEAGAAPERPAAESYGVREGDTLQSISTAFYGDQEHARTIADFNGLAIDAELKPGDVLQIPRLPDAENTDTARVE